MLSPPAPPGSVEQYRRLAATLHHAQAQTGLKIVMVASAMPGEGKTLTATNLALTLSESYRRKVLLIDADLRRPTMHQIFDIPNIAGLNEALTAFEALPSAFELSPRLTLLPAGRPNPDPIGILTSPAMRELVTKRGDGFDWVIVDTPPVGLLTDANLLAGMVDAVVHGRRGRQASVQDSAEVGRRARPRADSRRRAEPRRGRSRSAVRYQYEGYYGQPARRSLSRLPMSNILMQRLTWRSTTLIGFESLLIAVRHVGWRSICASAGATPAQPGWCRGCCSSMVVCQLVPLLPRPVPVPRAREPLGAVGPRRCRRSAPPPLILALLYSVLPSLIIGRGVFVTSGLFVAVVRHRLAARLRVDLAARRAARAAAAGRHGQPRRRAGPRAVRAARARVEIVGFVDPDPARSARRSSIPNVIGTIEDIPSIVRARGVDRVVVSLADARGKLPMDKLLEMKLDGVTFDHLASVYEEYTGKIAVENLRPSWLIFSAGFRKSRAAARRASARSTCSAPARGCSCCGADHGARRGRS